MCGVYGFLGVPNINTAGNIQCLGLLNSERGTDSTGLAFIAKNRHAIIKRAVYSQRFFGKRNVQNLMGMFENEKFLTVLGHTRLATRGKVNRSNAHPFKNGRIVFVHNGVISNFDQLQARFKTDFTVDSQMIGYLLRYHDFRTVFANLHGSFAVPYVDLSQKDKLRVAVHNQVFSYAISKDKKRLYFSSCMRHLKEGLELETHQFDFYEAGQDIQYVFTFKNGQILTDYEEIDVPASYYTYTGRNGQVCYV